VNGKTKKISVSPEIEYYINDKIGKSDKKNIWGDPVVLQKADSRKEMNDFIKFANVKTCESTIADDVKFLQKRYLHEKLVPNMDDFQIATIDIELASGDDFPDDVAESVPYPINLISVHYSKTDEIITYGLEPYTGRDESVKNYHFIPDESRLLEIFISDFRKRRVDIVTGWNIKLFDMPYIINRAATFEIETSLSPLNMYKDTSVRDDFGNTKNAYIIPGLSILDGLESYKKFTFVKRASYKLNNIGEDEVGEGKLEYEGQINHIYKTDWDKFVEYNVQDVILTKKIEDKRRFIPLIVNLCYDALIPFEKVYSSISLITGFFIRYLHKKNIMFPDPLKDVHKEAYPGAFVMALEGLYKYVMSYDIQSEYPKMIMQFNISPETLVLNPTNTEGLIRTPCSDLYECDTPSGRFQVSGIYYKKERGILPEITETVFNERVYLKDKSKVADGLEKRLDLPEIAKNNGMDIGFVTQLAEEIGEEGYTSQYYDSQQMIRKIIINSMYGVLGTPYFAFYNVHNAMAITIGGRTLIQHLSNSINDYMKESWHKVAMEVFPEICKKPPPQIKDNTVVLIDTDSNYLCLDEMIKGLRINFRDNEEYRQFGNILDKRFLKPFFTKALNNFADTYGVEQIHKFEREKIVITKIVLAMKKYADLVIDDEGKTTYKDGTTYSEKPKMSITGIEMVRASTPEFCKNHLTSMLRLIMESGSLTETTEALGEVYDMFMEEKVEKISKCSSVNTYSKYAPSISEMVEEDNFHTPKGCPYHVKAAIAYNFLVKKYKLPLEPVGNGGDVKLVQVNPVNELGISLIAYVGSYPKFFNDIFKLDKEEQWEKQFTKIMQRFYDVVDWGTVQVDTIDTDGFIEFS
tara:strand:- start:5486 stop:8071 length:2586 start_codon:yes stop_codon:yes gene_type:complete